MSLAASPGALGEPSVLACLWLLELALVWPLCVLVHLVVRDVSRRILRSEQGAALGASLAVACAVPLTTLLELDRFGPGRKPIVYALGLFVASLAWIAPCVAFAPWAARIPRSVSRVLVAALPVATCALVALLWWRGYPTREAVVAKQRPSGPQHVILLTIDTLRPDFLSTYEPKARRTAVIDALGRDSVVFEKAMSLSPWTKPSLTTLLSGLPPTRHAVLRRYDRVDDRFDLLAERFARAGYRTGAVTFNPFLDLPSNFQQGFAEYAAFPRRNLGKSLAAQAARALALPLRHDPGNTPEMTARAREWLREHAREPFFLWVHYYDPHQPYEAPAPYAPKGTPPSADLGTFSQFSEVRGGHRMLDAKERAWIRELYAGEVQLVDHEVGELLGELRTLGLYDDAIIVLASDHGEELFEHGGFEHGHSLYEELLRVPLMIKLPGKQRTGRVSARVSLADVYPTLMALSGLPVVGDDGLPRSVPLFERATIDDRDASFVAQGMLYFEDKISVTRNDQKYIHSFASGRDELYDLASDPGEQHSASDAAPERLPGLRDALRTQHRAEGGKHDVLDLGRALPSAPENAADPEMLRSLRALGYVQ